MNFLSRSMVKAPENTFVLKSLILKFLKNRDFFFSSCRFISEIYILNNKKFKWRYYEYGLAKWVE
jgi:hypothetical protein